MRVPPSSPRFLSASLWMCVLAAFFAGGCSRVRHRVKADNAAYEAIAERNGDPRWAAENFSIEQDPRSRYFDIYDPDHPPMPQDDPTSHWYMHQVDGKSGWKYWHANGDRPELENPDWREALGGYVELDEAGAVKLDVDSALQLAYVHSPNHQRQLETLYLSALDVTAERFRLDTQFFGGYDAIYNHRGSLAPAGLTYDASVNKYVVTQPVHVDALENNRVTVGRPGAGAAVRMQRRMATAGELLVGFANSFVFEFTGGDANLSASLANFSIMQPLLRGAGKDIALEELTADERALLSNLRAYGQFRQGFYTQVAIGELGVTGPQRGGDDTNLQSFSGQGGVGGYLGLLQQIQQIRNVRDNLDLQERTLERLEALYDNELIDLVQVDQFRQSVESQKADLLARENSRELSLDTYKTGTLGLPPDLPIDLDESLIEPFRLFPQEANEIQQSLLDIRRRLREAPVLPEVEQLSQLLTQAAELVAPAEKLFEMARQELAKLEKIAPGREKTMDAKQIARFREERKRLQTTLEDLEKGELGFNVAVAKLKLLRGGLAENTRPQTFRGVISWTGEFLQVVERLALVPAQARLEMITVEPVPLGAEEAFQIALGNRLDFMNGRAALVDSWRQVQVSADALQAVLNVTASGDLRTARNNPLSLRGPTGNLRMGLEFDAPFTRLLERNAYRESLITYQQNRRQLIQSHDSLQLGLRALLRNLEQLRRNLEIQRRAVTIAMRRVDQTQLLLNPPRQPAQPGARAQINPTTAINLLGAQSSLQNTQNSFLSAWLNYYAARLRLYRELGVMQLDSDGRWLEVPLPGQTEEEAAPEAERRWFEVNHSRRSLSWYLLLNWISYDYLYWLSWNCLFLRRRINVILILEN